MKLRLVRFVALAAITFLAAEAQAAAKYWVGSSAFPTPNGNWDNGVTATWSEDDDPAGTAVTFNSDDSVFFSAGSGATGNYTVTVTDANPLLIGAVNAATDGIFFQEGNATITGGTLDVLGVFQVEAGATGTINSVLQSATAGVTKTGPGRLTLGGDSATTFGGTISVTAGTLAATHSGVFGTAGTATTANATVVSNGATLELADNVSVADRVFVNGTGDGGVGAIRKVGAGSSTITGGLTFSTAATVIADAGTLTLSGGAIFGSATATVGGAGNITTTGTPNTNFAIGTNRLVKIGAGTLTLGGNSSFIGGITVEGGVVSFSADVTGAGSQQLGSTATAPLSGTNEYKPAAVILNGGTLRATNTATMFSNNMRGMQIGAAGGTVDASSALVVWGSTIRKTPDATDATLTKTGPGEFRYNANTINTRIGTDFTQLVVNQGLFRLGSVAGFDTEEGFGAVPLAPKADAIVLDGGAIGTSFGTTLNVNRGITLGANGGSFNVSAASMVVPGVITGPGALKKDTAGTLTIQGANTYAGGTNVSNGTLIAGTAAATLGTGNVNITGGTLQISAGVANAIADTAAVSIAGGIMSLGAGIDDLIGSLTLGGTLQPGGTYGSTASSATFKNDTFFSGAGILTVTSLTLPGDYNNDNKVDAADYVVWRRDPDAHGGNPAGYNTWRANFGAGTGSAAGSGSLSGGGAVPEPAALGLVALAAVALAAPRRRSR